MTRRVIGWCGLLALASPACGGAGAGRDDDGRCVTNRDCPGGICVDQACRYADGAGDAGDGIGPDGSIEGTDPRDGDGGDSLDDGVTTDGWEGWPTGPELCGDGLDNDGDGAVDERCGCVPGETQTCYAGPAPVAGIGVCAQGTQTCEGGGEFGEWGGCSGSVGPGAEICGDGLDNDCDGSADEGCVCDPGERRTCYMGPPGTEGVGDCRAGTQACVEAEGGDGSTWSDCYGQTLPSPDFCDGLDNDCDGRPDQGCLCEPGSRRACYEGPSGTRGRGICVEGNQGCIADPGGLLSDWGACVGWVGPATETCADGIDNDCDGMTDEGCGCLIGERRLCYTGPMGTAGIGECRWGYEPCEALPGGGSDWGDCTGSVAPAPDVCDGRDNDCNGLADDGCLCEPYAMEACYEGPPATRGRGICLDGIHECQWTPGAVTSWWGPCVGWVGPSPERCDAIDNDCDGTIDEGCACSLGATRSCYSGPPGTSGVGRCRSGSQTCVEVSPGVNGWGACSGEVLPLPEACGNGIDDDCDGAVDEGCSCTPGAVRSCYTGPPSTRSVGDCRDGSQRCVEIPGSGSSWTACAGEVLPALETCDGRDNDCDGATDEACLCTPGAVRSCYSGPPSTRGVGECRDGSQICIEVPGSGSNWGTCTGERVPVSEICGNGLDEDCDGAPDDGCTRPPPCVTCPPSPVRMPARSTITLTAADCGSGSSIVNRRWEVISGPTGMIYSFGCPTCASTSYRADIAGIYTIRHTVTDSEGRTASCTVTVEVTGLGLRVEVTWSSSTADIDTHVLNGSGSWWATSSSDGNDCHFRNCRGGLAWPPPGADGDARLDIDDVDGYGPENVNVDVINIGEVYRVGVHWWSGHGNSSSSVTVRIFCGDISAIPVRVMTRTISGSASSSGALAENNLWKVADVRFTDPDNCTVTSLDLVVPSGPGNISR